MQAAPDDEGPAGSMPEPAQQHGDHQAQIEPRRTAPVAAQITDASPALVHWFGRAGSTAGLADGSVLGVVDMVAFLILSFGLCLGARNFQQMSVARRIVIAGAVTPFLLHAVLFGAGPSAFIYFRF